MATIGVLTYTLPPGLKLKNTGLNKIALSTLSGSHENKNAIITKIQDIGMISGEVLMMRKKQKLVPLLDSNAKNVQQEPSTKRLKLSDNNSNNVIKSGHMISAGKKAMPLPQAVARRNARERNRVKQVNNGFAALREHIPDEIAEAFEAAGNGRGSAKKLSKVETLRMAVEYIRSLERLLELDNSKMNSNETETLTSRTVIKTEGNCTPVLDDYYSESNYDSEDNISYLNDTLPDITTVNGQQYIRIPGTNTYQLITTEIFENEENIQPLATDSFAVGPASNQMDFVLTTGAAEEISPTIAPALGSTTERFGGSKPTLSPADHLQHNQHLLSQLQMQQQQQHVHVKSKEASAVIYQSQLAPNSPPISEGQGFVDIQLYDGVGGGNLKREIKEEVILETAALSEESMMEAIDWWDAHTPQSDESVIL